MQPDWDQRYRQGDTPWDKGRASPALIAWLEDNQGRMTGSVLVPGCGRGHDVRAIASAEPTSFPVGIDISKTAIEECRQNKVLENERYEKENLFSLPKTLLGTCDWLWEHTCFCAIDPKERPAYVSAVAAGLKPDGFLLGIFYLNPQRTDTRAANGPPHGTTIQELESLFLADGVFSIMETFTPRDCYPEREGREQLLLLRRTKNQSKPSGF